MNKIKDYNLVCTYLNNRCYLTYVERTGSIVSVFLGKADFLCADPRIYAKFFTSRGVFIVIHIITTAIFPHSYGMGDVMSAFALLVINPKHRLEADVEDEGGSHKKEERHGIVARNFQAKFHDQKPKNKRYVI